MGNEWRVLIADHHEPYVRAATACASDFEGVKVVGHCRNAEEVLELAAKRKVDLVLLDFAFAGAGTRALIARLKALEEPPTVALLHQLPEHVAANGMTRLDADALISKHELRRELARLLVQGNGEDA